ncbi:MAG: polyprenyl diphosphate synthase [Clostridia bacterium]|nr:polyprenyl diphosphate synthase [Clostridia bacterium]
MRHLAIIIDGNGRWAVSRGLERLSGHAEGAKAVARAIEAAYEMKLECVTFYAFSTENFKRGTRETLGIFAILAGFLEETLLPLVQTRGLRVRFIGNLARLSSDLLTIISKVNVAGLNNRGMTVVIAVGYSGRDEIAQAINILIEQKLLNSDASPVTYEELSRFLYTANLPDPDAVWRFGGYKRLSNFLPLQTVYSELFFTEKLWPDFQKEDLYKLCNDFKKIKRNFGDLPK